MKSAIIQLETLTCPSCSQKIEAALKALDGVDKESINISFTSSKVKLNFDEGKISLKDIEDAIRRMGYDIEKSKIK
ncbi:MAG TPA: heavy metal-associated domain-containing protein [Tissierellaceae bacterium]